MCLSHAKLKNLLVDAVKPSNSWNYNMQHFHGNFIHLEKQHSFLSTVTFWQRRESRATWSYLLSQLANSIHCLFLSCTSTVWVSQDRQSELGCGRGKIRRRTTAFFYSHFVFFLFIMMDSLGEQQTLLENWFISCCLTVKVDGCNAAEKEEIELKNLIATRQLNPTIWVVILGLLHNLRGWRFSGMCVVSHCSTYSRICNSVAEYIDDQKVIKRKRVGLSLRLFISVTQLLSKIQKTPTTE